MGREDPSTTNGRSAQLEISQQETPTHDEDGVTRRRFVEWGSKLMIGLTALLGGVVGFAPTALAAVNCLPGTKKNLFGCFYGCVGPCLCNGDSCCKYGGNFPFCCGCLNECGHCNSPRAKAVVVCSINEYGCCVSC